MIKEQRSSRTRRLSADLLIPFLAFAILSGGVTAFLTFDAFVARPAHAEAYRFWGYWLFEDGTWVLPDKGPADVVPAHGSVEGWRYAISGEAAGQRVPRTTVGFDEICGTGEPAEGRKKVGLILDFGVPNESPDGSAPPESRAECVEVDADATSAQVLAEVASIRQEKGLVCAIDGYPAKGCADPVADVPTVASPEPTIELRLPGEEASDGTDRSGADPSDRNAADDDTAASDDATASDDPEATAADEPSESGSTLWAVVVIAAIVLLAIGGFWQHRRRGVRD